MRLLLLHKYGRRAASFRYRFEQYLPYLAQAGFHCVSSSLLEDDYLGPKLDLGRQKFGAAFRGFLRRVGVVLAAGSFDVVMIGLDLLPYFPALAERYFHLRKIPYVIDFDDAVFHGYDHHRLFLVRRLLGRKFDYVLSRASLVFAGSDYLYEYAGQRNGNVVKMPTVVDLARYSEKRVVCPRSDFTVGWIGSPSGRPGLRNLMPTLQAFAAARPKVRYLFVGCGEFAAANLPLEIRAWSEETEMADLAEFDVGLMPLEDNPWNRGKCGFKLIQYMAVGIPSVASPVGENVSLLSGGAGYLANSSDAWRSSLEQLYDNESLRRDLGHAGRKLVEKSYCLNVTAPRMISSLRAIRYAT